MTKRNSKAGSSQPQPQMGNSPETQTVTQERPAHIDNGDDTRGSVNARENQTRTQPETSPAMAAIDGETGENVVALRRSKGDRQNIFATVDVQLTEAFANKAAQLSEARQRIAEAADLYQQGSAAEGEAKVAADKAMLSLYQARTAGTLTADELTQILGDGFGFRVKGGVDRYDPKATGGAEMSKTPFGAGEAIRKRIVRAVQAYQHVNGGDGGRFFEGLEDDRLVDAINGLTKGQIGFWRAYDLFAEIKRDNMEKVKPAFNPKHIASLAEALNQEGAAAKIAANRGLQESYVALLKMINVVGEEAASIARKAA